MIDYYTKFLVVLCVENSVGLLMFDKMNCSGSSRGIGRDNLH